MDKKETRLESDMRQLRWAVSVFKDSKNPDGMLEAIIDLANRINFEKTYPHVERAFDSVYSFIDSMANHISALEDRVDELEKQIAKDEKR